MRLPQFWWIHLVAVSCILQISSFSKLSKLTCSTELVREILEVGRQDLQSTPMRDDAAFVLVLHNSGIDFCLRLVVAMVVVVVGEKEARELCDVNNVANLVPRDVATCVIVF